MKFRVSICAILAGLLIYACCKKDSESRIVDLKTKSLPELKSILDGRWQLHYAIISTIAGNIKQEANNNFIVFSPIDSIKWTGGSNNILIAQDKMIYAWIFNSYNESAYNLSFHDAILSNTYNWTPEKIENDTLVFFDNSRVGSSYHLTRK